MPDPKDEIKPGEVSPNDEFVYKRDSSKSLRQIGKEVEDRRKKRLAEKKKEDEKTEIKTDPKEEKPVDDKPKEETKPETAPKVEEKPTEPKIDPEAVAKKAAEEAATKVAEETKAAFKDEISKILDKDKDILEKQQEADELVAIWDKENRLPKNYQELISETMRIAETKMEQRGKIQKEREDEERKAVEKTKADEESQTRVQQEKQVEDFNKQIASDLDEIYSANLLPRPAKFDEINNPNTTDPAAKETQKILEFGVKLNIERVKQGLEPVRSLNKIFFLHYKPAQDAAPKKDEQPAGADAPVGGAKNAPTEGDSNKINYTQLHNETWAQTKARIAREFFKKRIGNS